jgi:tetratricopeptide (TPR) repeat protein
LAENFEGLPPEIERLSERLAKDPKSLVFSSLANAYRKNNMIDEAIEILQKGLEIHPDYASARTVLGKCYADKRMYELAKEEFKKALAKDPQNIVILENLGQIYKTLNQHDEAYDIYKRLLELDPLNPEFEKEVESLKNMVGDISTHGDQFDSFQTIKNEQTEVSEEAEQEESEEEKPTLSEIFEEPSEVISEQNENMISTSNQFTEIFEPKKPSEKPVIGEENPSEEPGDKTLKEQKPEEGPHIVQEPEKETEEEEQTPEETVAQPEQKPEEEPRIVQEPEKETEEKEQTPEETVAQPEQKPEEGPHIVQEPEKETEEETPPQKKDTGVETEKKQDEIRMEGITSIFDTTDLETQEQEVTEEISKEVTTPSKEETKIEKEKESEVEKNSDATDEKPAATATLAEIYLSQGFVEEALNIYKELLSKDPENENLKKKINNLEQQLGGANTQDNKEDLGQESAEKKKNTAENADENISTSQQEKEVDNKQDAQNLDNFQDWLNKFKK